MSLTLVALQRADSAAIEAHLLRLSAADRSMRFTAGVVTDETIRRYVASLPFERDGIFAWVDATRSVVALALGCVYRADGGLHIEAAFSVDQASRRQGLCIRLMARLEAFAAEVGAQSLLAMCVVRNLPMRRIFERSGMCLSREDDEIHAHLLIREAAVARTRVTAGCG